MARQGMKIDSGAGSSRILDEYPAESFRAKTETAARDEPLFLPSISPDQDLYIRRIEQEMMDREWKPFHIPSEFHTHVDNRDTFEDDRIWEEVHGGWTTLDDIPDEVPPVYSAPTAYLDRLRDEIDREHGHRGVRTPQFTITAHMDVEESIDYESLMRTPPPFEGADNPWRNRVRHDLHRSVASRTVSDPYGKMSRTPPTATTNTRRHVGNFIDNRREPTQLSKTDLKNLLSLEPNGGGLYVRSTSGTGKSTCSRWLRSKGILILEPKHIPDCDAEVIQSLVDRGVIILSNSPHEGIQPRIDVLPSAKRVYANMYHRRERNRLMTHGQRIDMLERIRDSFLRSNNLINLPDNFYVGDIVASLLDENIPGILDYQPPFRTRRYYSARPRPPRGRGLSRGRSKRKIFFRDDLPPDTTGREVRDPISATLVGGC